MMPPSPSPLKLPFAISATCVDWFYYA